MDIHIDSATEHDGLICITRTMTYADGRTIVGIHEMPKETLAIRAAEYDLEPDDTRVLDMVLLEHLILVEEEKTHPLFAEDNIADALTIVMARIDAVKAANSAPKGDAGILALAAETPAASQGLKDAKALLSLHADPEIATWVKHHRDVGRTHAKNIPQKKSLTQQMKESALNQIQREADLENKRFDRKKKGLL